MKTSGRLQPDRRFLFANTKKWFSAAKIATRGTGNISAAGRKGLIKKIRMERAGKKGNKKLY